MASYASVFNAAAVRSKMLERPQNLTRQTFVQLQDAKIAKLQNNMNKKVKWFLDHGDWQAALRIIMLNFKDPRNRQVERNSTTSVVTPETFTQLLDFDSPSSGAASSSPSKTALAYFIRDQALSDEIPNSPALYQNLVDNFCRTHHKPETALEVAVEGNARWRFGHQEKQKMGMLVLDQCAKQKNCWSVACQTMQVLINNNNNSKQQLPSSTSSSSVKQIHELLGKAAYNSGLWRTVVQKEEEEEEVIEIDINENVNRDLDKSSIIWKAVYDASRAGEPEKALQLFNKIIDSSQNHLNHIRAVHELINSLGFQGNRWKTVVEVANKWIFKLNNNNHVERHQESGKNNKRVIDDTLSNLVFSSFPSPFNDEETEINGKNHDAFVAASELFDTWMAEVEDFVPPPLTCALMVGFWNKIQGNNNTNNSDWIKNSMSLLSKFTIEQLDQNSPHFYKILVSIDDASYNALQKARKVLLPLVHDHNLHEISDSKSSSSFLNFPSTSHIRMLDHRKLFDHRRKQWKLRYELQSQHGTRSWLSRPARQDYFPAFGASSMLGLQDVVDDQGDLESAMRFAQHVGKSSFDNVDVDDTNLHNSHIRGGGLFRPVDMKNNNVSNASSETLFQDHRPGPFGKNERLNGWEHYGMGGQIIYPGHKSKVASPYHNMRPKRMKNMFSPTRNWRNSSVNSQLKTVSKNYKYGSAV